MFCIGHSAVARCSALFLSPLFFPFLPDLESKKTQNPRSTSVKLSAQPKTTVWKGPIPLLLKARCMGRRRLKSRNWEILNQISHSSCCSKAATAEISSDLFLGAPALCLFSSNSDQTRSWNSGTGSAARQCFLRVRCHSQQGCQGRKKWQMLASLYHFLLYYFKLTTTIKLKKVQYLHRKKVQNPPQSSSGFFLFF